MSDLQHNLFIIDDNTLQSMPLKKYLFNEFGTSLQITTYQTAEFALSKIDKDTHIVILSNNLKDQTSSDLIQAIKKVNQNTEVIVLSSNEDMAYAIQTYRKGATDLVLKGNVSYRRIAKKVYEILSYPIKLLVSEFRVRKYLLILLITFVTVGVIVYITLVKTT